jgi:hypothetical protein
MIKNKKCYISVAYFLTQVSTDGSRFIHFIAKLIIVLEQIFGPFLNTIEGLR